MQYSKILFATANPGKLNEIKRIALEYGLEISSPAELSLPVLDVIEDGATFKENAAKKVAAYTNTTKDESVLVIGDDSGIEIPVLNNMPGVHTRRWAGYAMSDQEIIDYCLKQMEPYHDDDRKAVFKTTLALGSYNKPVQYFEGLLEGELAEKPDSRAMLPGLPFGNIFFIPEIDKYLIDLHGKSLAERNNFMTHREKALNAAYGYIKSLDT